MAYRFMQVFMPEASEQDIEALLDGCDVIHMWRDTSVEDRSVIQLPIEADAAESIMDRFEEAFADDNRFHVLLFPLEAVIPRINGEGSGEAQAKESQDEAKEEIQKAGRISREELYGRVTETLAINRVFVAMALLSAVVAAVGLLRDDVAVIIGAMVIAPLLGPNVATSLATALGDINLMREGLFASLVGMSLALAVSVLVGAIFAIDVDVPAISVRTHIGIDGVVLALAAGSAGTFAFTRGMANAVVGVMVAVALLPPLVVFGMLLGAGQFAPAAGALILVVGNVVCINLAGAATFLAQGVRPRNWREEKTVRRASYSFIAVWCLLLGMLAAVLAALQFWLQ